MFFTLLRMEVQIWTNLCHRLLTFDKQQIAQIMTGINNIGIEILLYFPFNMSLFLRAYMCDKPGSFNVRMYT